MTVRRPGPALVGVGGALLTAVALVVAAGGTGNPSALQLAAIGISVALPFAVAFEVLRRYPERTLGRLLLGVGIAYFIRALASSDSAVAYSVSRALGQFGDVLLVWLMLVFPSGRLQGRAARTIVWAGALSVVLLWWPVVALSPQIPAAGPLVPCSPACPHNALLVANNPSLAHVFEVAFRVVPTVVLIATAALLAVRLRRASSLTRRMIAPVLVASLARCLGLAAFLALDSPSWVRGFLLLTYWAILVAIAVGLFRGRSFDAAALERLVQGLRARPGPEQMRAVMADALGDPTLKVAYRLPGADTYARADGSLVDLRGRPGRAQRQINDESGAPIALLELDDALLDHAELLDAVSTSAAIALQQNRLEAEVAAARAGTIAALSSERRRIERDLHDGAQQRLIALRMKVTVAQQLLERDSARARAMLDELGSDLELALAEVRALAHGTAPPILVERGLADAVTAAAREYPLALELRTDGMPRLSMEIETELYFVCREAMQNAAKHAGPAAHVIVELTADRAAARLEVCDDGTGFEPLAASLGAGLANMRERIEQVGGSLTVSSQRGAGTDVRAVIPLAGGSTVSLVGSSRRETLRS